MARKIKLNRASLWLGNSTLEDDRLNYASSIDCTGIQLYGLQSIWGTGLEAALPAFITKAKNTYGFATVGAIIGSVNSTNGANAYNLAQPSALTKFDEYNLENEFWFGYRVDFYISSPIVVGFTYTFSITYQAVTKTYSYTAVLGDTSLSIANALLAACNANPTVGFTYGVIQKSTNTWAVQVINRNNISLDFTYTNSANTSTELVNYSYTQWDAWAKYTQGLANITGTILTAYVANPLSNWPPSATTDMIATLDEIELTNYRTFPNERSGAFRTAQLIPLADAAAAAGVSLNFWALHSAEPAFMKSYLDQNTIIAPPFTTASEDYWLNLWNTDSFTNIASAKHVGFVYFDYNNMTTAPAVQL